MSSPLLQSAEELETELKNVERMMEKGNSSQSVSYILHGISIFISLSIFILSVLIEVRKITCNGNGQNQTAPANT